MITIKFGSEKLQANVAKTQWQKFRGLMLQKNIKPLLFIFDREHVWQFHMLFMRKSIAVIFLNAQKKVVDIQTARPWQFRIKPKAAAQYVLELPISFESKFSENQQLVFAD